MTNINNMTASNTFIKLVLKQECGSSKSWDFNPSLKPTYLEKLVNDILDNIPHVDWYMLEPLKQ